MNIEDKIKLTEQSLAIYFIKDSGLFCRMYNQSAYIVTHLLKHKLKLQVKKIKKMNNQFIISCGLPIDSVLNRFPDVKKTDWGYILSKKFDMSCYQDWRLYHIHQAKAKMVKDSQYSQYENVYNNQKINRIELLSENFRLTSEQIVYLLKRKEGKYPTNFDHNFLSELALNIRSFSQKHLSGKTK